jgi:hypothetical protein
MGFMIFGFLGFNAHISERKSFMNELEGEGIICEVNCWKGFKGIKCGQVKKQWTLTRSQKCTIVAMMSPFWKRELTWTFSDVKSSLFTRWSLSWLVFFLLWFCFEWNDDKRKNFRISWLKTYFMKTKLLFSTNLQQNLWLFGF